MRYKNWMFGWKIHNLISNTIALKPINKLKSNFEKVYKIEEEANFLKMIYVIPNTSMRKLNLK
jgi:hypothetical protein